MRQIKYKAWDKEIKEIVDIDKIDFNLGYAFYVDDKEEVQRVPLEDLMQFTGLTDKNGKEIYEMYIVETDNYNGKHKFKISYENDFCGCLGVFHAECVDDEQISSVHSEVCTDCEVIGNIYENPELLTNDARLVA